MRASLGFCLFTVICSMAIDSVADARALPHVQEELRVQHARELLGKHYARSVVARAESDASLHRFIYGEVRAALPKHYAGEALKVTRALIEEGTRYKMDPIFLLAVAKHESKFNPLARGTHGEIGLMQLKPATAREVARKIGLRWHGPDTLRDMVANIRLGAAYMSQLRNRFGFASRYYLAAYNSGAAGVRRKIASFHAAPRVYPRLVMQEYLMYYKDLARTRTN